MSWRRGRKPGSPYQSRQGDRFSAGGCPRMTTETELHPQRLPPRILETEEIGRLELSLPSAPETHLPSIQRARRRSPFAIAAAGLGVLALGVVGIDTAQFIDGAFAHGTGLGVLAAVAVTAGCGGAAYWLIAELRGLWRLRSAER